MSVLVINAADILDSQQEAHYQFLSYIPPEHYPQVHDFHEIVLVTHGSLLFTSGGIEQQLNQGDLQWACPGIVHGKKNLDSCQHINIAFPSSTVSELFQYLGLPKEHILLWQKQGLHKVHLNIDQTFRMKNMMHQLGLIHLSKPDIVKTKLRFILAKVFVDYFFPVLFINNLHHAPKWMDDLLRWLDNTENLTMTVCNLAAQTGCTSEHLCRVFKRTLNTTPGRYIESKRMNYAANMLLHSDLSVIDIAFQSGYQSLAPFYAAFKSTYGMTPQQYRKVDFT